VLGEHGWNQLEPVVGPWLDWPASMPTEAGAQALCVTFAFALHAGLPFPRGSKLGGLLVSFRARFKVEPPVLDLLLRELG
jgi:hypothetical protein